MIIVADSGSTKTDWRIVANHNEAKHIESIGLNPYFINQGILLATLDSAFQHSLAEQIEAIYFYGAGCSDPDAIKFLKDGFQSFFHKAKNIEIHHDILGAARALCGTNAGFASILGTGMNTCLFDGKNIVANKTSFGYIFGDEGGGCYLGKLFTKKYLEKQLPITICQQFEEELELNREKLIIKLYKESFPNRFLASFVPFIYKNKHLVEIQEIIEQSFADFFTYNVKYYPEYTSQPWSFTGSVAKFFESDLRNEAIKHGITISKIEQKPIGGLINYHLNT